jgi:hypothetical protein
MGAPLRQGGNVFGLSEPERSPEPTLVRLLDQPAVQSDASLIANARIFARSAENLSPRDRRRLRRRLGRWWREGELASAVRRTAANSYSVDGWAAAWLSYGPAIDASLRPDQWAEIALFGLNVNDQHEWLQRQHSRAGERIAARLCRGRGISAWADLLSAVPSSPTPELLEAMIARARRVDDAYKLTRVGERLVAAGDLGSLRRLASIGSGFARGLLPSLAAAGDYDAQKKLLRRLKRTLARGGRPEYPEILGWLRGVEDPRLMPDLVGCLRLAYPLEGDYQHDVVNPLQAAIQRVGGMVAIHAYDELLQEDIPGIQFLHTQRDAVSQDLLAKSGLRAARPLAAQIGLPLIDAGD